MNQQQRVVQYVLEHGPCTDWDVFSGTDRKGVGIKEGTKAMRRNLGVCRSQLHGMRTC